MWSADHLLNGAFTASYASPQLIEQVKAMADAPMTDWAIGAVLFQLLSSTERQWTRRNGTFKSGPMIQDLRQLMTLTDDMARRTLICEGKSEETRAVSTIRASYVHLDFATLI